MTEFSDKEKAEMAAQMNRQSANYMSLKGDRKGSQVPHGEWKYNRFGHYELTWDDGSDLYLQLESDVESFTNDIGFKMDQMETNDFGDIPDSINWDYWNVAEHPNITVRKKEINELIKAGYSDPEITEMLFKKGRNPKKELHIELPARGILNEKQRDRIINLMAYGPLPYRKEIDDSLFGLGLLDWYDRTPGNVSVDANHAVLGMKGTKPFYNQNGSISEYYYRFNPNRPTKEYWRKVFPAVKKSLQKYGWKGRGAKTLDEAAAAVTADMWYHKIDPGTKEFYEIMRKRREGR